MGKKLYFAPSRRAGLELFRWSMLALAGVGGGMALGEMAAGTRLQAGAGAGAGGAVSYSGLSANPDALVPPGETSPGCPGCSDSYGVAARMRAQHENRMSEHLRELGSVDHDISPPAEAGDEYHYGGRFPDATSDAAETPVPRDNVSVVVPANENFPAGPTATSTAEY